MGVIVEPFTVELDKPRRVEFDFWAIAKIKKATKQDIRRVFGLLMTAVKFSDDPNEPLTVDSSKLTPAVQEAINVWEDPEFELAIIWAVLSNDDPRLTLEGTGKILRSSTFLLRARAAMVRALIAFYSNDSEPSGENQAAPLAKTPIPETISPA